MCRSCEVSMILFHSIWCYEILGTWDFSILGASLSLQPASDSAILKPFLQGLGRHICDCSWTPPPPPPMSRHGGSKIWKILKMVPDPDGSWIDPTNVKRIIWNPCKTIFDYPGNSPKSPRRLPTITKKWASNVNERKKPSVFLSRLPSAVLPPEKATLVYVWFVWFFSVFDAMCIGVLMVLAGRPQLVAISMFF